VPAAANAPGSLDVSGNKLDMSTTLETNAVADAPTADDFLSRPEYAEVAREVRPAPPRYRNEIGKYSIRRASTCLNCGHCVELCPRACIAARGL